MDHLDDLINNNPAILFSVLVWARVEVKIDDVIQDVHRHEKDQARSSLGLLPRRRAGR